MVAERTEVVIAGAGPSGLMVAAELAGAGVAVIVLERRAEPALPRAGTITPRVMEIFACQGLADTVLERAWSIHQDPRAPVAIWAGFHGVHYDVLDTDYPFALLLAQMEVERILQDRAVHLGARVLRGHEVTGLRQGPDEVEVLARTDGGTARTFRAQYLVGADGARSTVRERAGVGSDRTRASRTAINLDAVLDYPWPEPIYVTNNLNGWGLSYELRTGLTRFGLIDAEASLRPPEIPVTLEQGKQILRRIYGTDFGIAEATVSRFHNELALADRMRDGRVFLVGESVRVHYPASGVGMNFCLQDAFNLGWKLAAAVQGWAPDWLLDSYEAERRPEILKLIDDVQRQCAVQFAFSPDMLAMKKMIEHELMPMSQVNRLLAGNLSGLDARYPSPVGQHDLVGKRLANISLLDSAGGTTSVFELLQGRRFLLLDLTGAEVPPLAGTAARRVTVVSGVPAHQRDDLSDICALLVRPDGHVAWTGRQPLARDLPAAELDRWLAAAA
jgi:2-polyprenyl-6-methoxyphenol hydroxylase-like FAD-dependent oxidoreductase